MKYQITNTEEDYIQACILSDARRGRRSVLRILSKTLIIVLIIVLIAEGVILGFSFFPIFLAVLALLFLIFQPKLTEAFIRLNVKNLKKLGKLPFDEHEEIEFQDSMIVTRSERGELRVPYDDVEDIYSKKDYLFIFVGAVQLLVIPYRCLGEDKERVMAHLREKVDALRFHD